MYTPAPTNCPVGAASTWDPRPATPPWVALVDASLHLGASDPEADQKSFEEAGPRMAGSVFFYIEQSFIPPHPQIVR